MSINLVHAVNTAMTENIAEQLSRQFGIPVQIVRQVSLRVAPGLVAALMDRASLAAGARSLYSVVMLPETNAYIVDQFDKMISTTGGLKHLEATGHSLAALATGQRMDLLTDAVSTETGVPTQATSALAGIVAAALFGIVKRHVLLAQSDVTQFAGLMREQIPEIKNSLSNGVAAAIGVGNTEGFVSNIGARLDTAALALAQDSGGAPAMHASAAPAPLPPPPAPPPAASVARPASATLRAPARAPAARRRSNAWIWVLFAVLAAILGFVYYHGFTHQNIVSLDSSAPPATAASATPVTAIGTPASAVSLQAVTPDDQASSATLAAASAAASASAVVNAPGATAEAASATTASAPEAAGKDAEMVFSVSPAGVPNIQATVGTEAEKQTLTQTLEQRFGKNYVAAISVSPGTRPAAWLAHMADFLPLMSVPGAEAKVDGSKVELSGAATESQLGWTTRLKNSLGNAFTVGSFDVSGAIADAQRSFQSAVKTLVAADSACSGPKLTKVLDLQVVNFDSSSATVPQNAYATLGQTAQLLKDCAAKGSMVNLSVEGYSDSNGAQSAKVELSKERAQAVRGYLVRAGVPPQTLTAIGHGDANPVADNATASGRFANRRIAFVVR
jgi:OmpA-OmpF porin, OOP family